MRVGPAFVLCKQAPADMAGVGAPTGSACLQCSEAPGRPPVWRRKKHKRADIPYREPRTLWAT